MTYIGLDPSFTGYGIAVIQDDLKQVKLFDLPTSFDKHNTTLKFDAIKDITNQVKRITRSESDGSPTFIGQEVSTAYTGWMVAELFGLAYATYRMIQEKLEVLEHNLYSQTYINFIHAKKKRTKEETIFLLEDEILPLFEKHGYTIWTSKKAMTNTGVKEEGKNRYIRRETITNNEADAMIYALRQFVAYSDESELKKEILDICPRFKEDKHELS